jgi:hypothetical protein
MITIVHYLICLPMIGFFRTADKKLGQKVNEFIKEVQRTMGVQMFVIAGYRRPNGELTKVP